MLLHPSPAAGRRLGSPLLMGRGVPWGSGLAIGEQSGQRREQRRRHDFCLESFDSAVYRRSAHSRGLHLSAVRGHQDLQVCLAVPSPGDIAIGQTWARCTDLQTNRCTSQQGDKEGMARTTCGGEGVTWRVARPTCGGGRTYPWGGWIHVRGTL